MAMRVFPNITQEEEFDRLLSVYGYTGSLNDRQHAYIDGLGFHDQEWSDLYIGELQLEGDEEGRLLLEGDAQGNDDNLFLEGGE